MGKPTGFLEYERDKKSWRLPLVRLDDCSEIFESCTCEKTEQQAARCMDCGVPFCQSSKGCPIENLIPEWNDLVFTGRWREALDRLHATNNFPEFTGRVCPAPCEGACVLGINANAVSIKSIEQAIVDHGFAQGWIQPQPPAERTGRRVAVIGSGPAGLAAADQLNRVGHSVTVYEKQDRIGGLLMYGIPNMKLSKEIVERRVKILQEEGIEFRTNCDVGGNVDPHQLMAEHEAILLAVGASVPRGPNVPGKELKGIHYAMDFLTAQTKSLMGNSGSVPPIPSSKDKRVIVIGGGDTGTDCIATCLRQGCKSVLNLELLERPPESRDPQNPWPNWPRILRTDYGHEEAQARFGQDPRVFGVNTVEFLGDDDGHVCGLVYEQVRRVRQQDGTWKLEKIAESRQTLEADLVLIAMGFVSPEPRLAQLLSVEIDSAKQTFVAPHGSFQTQIPGLFAAGDCRRGQSLVVWAIHEGRGAARAIDTYLRSRTLLPAPGISMGGALAAPSERSRSLS